MGRSFQTQKYVLHFPSQGKSARERKFSRNGLAGLSRSRAPECDHIRGTRGHSPCVSVLRCFSQPKSPETSQGLSTRGEARSPCACLSRHPFSCSGPSRRVAPAESGSATPPPVKRLQMSPMETFSISAGGRRNKGKRQGKSATCGTFGRRGRNRAGGWPGGPGPGRRARAKPHGNRWRELIAVIAAANITPTHRTRQKSHTAL